ncbi:GntR family transcriptional regulator [Gordonia sp. zg691]|uniref:GntR family transcriptional regulator n=1 Tax=Gordonia jinghuaiqii TaxID=2758710 RepID=A0A7D7R4W8_9ACTN|nr:GntR family transcriptional regulator [Gordonia jinghuaiqii]MBD0863763.1 GntR family transcriptional regulator [Gordonia jinghuaiqii]MCR5980017.1 UTRA domain-containing protein [Gordonia jinghuaiqii]QMT03207.1 GntR family transcriptional regulator [Gordonia jinghuaiqii]
MATPAEISRHPRMHGGSANGRHSSVRWVRDMLAASIRAGHLPESAQLAEDALVSELGASRGTVRLALRSLADEGLLVRRPRLGTIVHARHARLEIADTVDRSWQGPEISLQIIDQRTVPATAFLRSRLETEDRSVRLLDVLFRRRGEVIGIRTAYFSRDVTYDFGEYTGPISMASLSASHFRTPMTTVVTEVTAAAADARTSVLLGITENSPVLCRTQVFAGADGHPLQVSFDQYRSDRASFVTEPLGLASDPPVVADRTATR